MTFDELKKEAIEKDWSAEQFEAALKEADIGFSWKSADPEAWRPC